MRLLSRWFKGGSHQVYYDIKKAPRIIVNRKLCLEQDILYCEKLKITFLKIKFTWRKILIRATKICFFFNVGSMVFLKLWSFRQKYFVRSLLAAKFYSPFKVLENFARLLIYWSFQMLVKFIWCFMFPN